jgi:hypothetical protein
MRLLKLKNDFFKVITVSGGMITKFKKSFKNTSINFKVPRVVYSNYDCLYIHKISEKDTLSVVELNGIQIIRDSLCFRKDGITALLIGA